eukprot:m.69982 g.69982  ORF g.69982 m.69982 type:complete len:370 (+) comp7847_c0_seq2:21-1130(+)
MDIAAEDFEGPAYDQNAGYIDEDSDGEFQRGSRQQREFGSDVDSSDEEDEGDLDARVAALLRFPRQGQAGRSSAQRTAQSSRPEQHSRKSKTAAQPMDDEGDDEDFEGELDRNLQSQLEALRAEFGAKPQAKRKPKAKGTKGASVSFAEGTAPPDAPAAEPEEYDPLYFDSDDEDSASKRVRPSDLDLLYDPEADASDARWIAEHRALNYPPSPPPTNSLGQNAAAARNSASGLHAAPMSDAVLNCPACMTTLCLDCQQHDQYPSQFRAMFVLNCVIDRSEECSVPVPTTKKHKNRHYRNRKEILLDEEKGGSNFFKVRCNECNTVVCMDDGFQAPQESFFWLTTLRVLVAMYDAEEIYHFFNVLASEA